MSETAYTTHNDTKIYGSGEKIYLLCVISGVRINVKISIKL